MRKSWRRPLIPAIAALLALGVWAEMRYSRNAGEPIIAPQPNATPLQSATAPTPTLPAASRTAAVVPSTSLSNSVDQKAPPGSQTSLPQPTAALPPPNAPDQAAALIDLDKISLMLRDYRTLAGGNPVGTNAEIMASLMGDNAKQAKLAPADDLPLNAKGELLDRWGTPYFFHQLSRDHMEIRSAGEDKVLWTDDDPVIK